MYVKFKRPSGLGFNVFCLLLLVLEPLHCLPTIEQTQVQQSGNYVSKYLDKSPFNQPDLEDTIEEVQKILSQDPSLPRLTRGEIEELYEKVTREEYEKSLKAGDMSRADSMRALMLVLPYNTDSTEDNLQELYTRPPITKVIDVYTPPKPKTFATTIATDTAKNDTEQLGPTDDMRSKFRVTDASPTPFQPPAPQKVLKSSTPTMYVEPMTGFRPITTQAPVYNFALNAAHVAKTIKPNQRFSSQYSAKNTEFLRPIRPKSTTSRTTTIKAMADVLQNFGIVSQAQLRRNALTDDFVPAESAPQGVISSYVPQSINYGQLQQLYSQRTPPRITADAYSNFKPLNIGEEIRVKPEIEGYLTRFGIVANRKRKELDKEEKDAELYETKVINGVKRARKGVENKASGNSELDKLLENLKELDRLNIDPKMLKPSTTTTTTTTTTEEPPTTMRDIITNGAPMLIEAKKPVRRIDPHLDLNFGSTSNKENGNVNQLEKLLENLEELQKLKINPENVLKAVVSTTTTKPPTTQSQGQQQQEKFQRQANAQELEELLKHIQAAEQRKPASTTTTTTTTSTTKKPAMNGLSQLRRLLNNDSELERLYNEAREKAVGKTTTTSTTTTTTTTTTARPTTTTTKKPELPNLNVEELQKYLAYLDRSKTTTTSTTTSTTTTTTTPKPTTTTTTESTVKKAVVANDQILELINRVQELERAQTQKQPLPNYSTMPFLGFTSRNVNSPFGLENNQLYRSSNDFAQLQQLYEKVQNAQQQSLTGLEISTAKTQSQSQLSRTKSQDFAQRIIDITNDTGSGSSLQQVGPNEFVHLQKLLKKVQELERVRIGPNGVVQTMSSPPTIKTPRELAATTKPKLASVESAKVTVYAMPAEKHSDISSSEELRDFIAATPSSAGNIASVADFERYPEFFDNLEEPESTGYKNKQPPVIQKTVTKQPPRFVEMRKPQDLPRPTKPTKKDDLKELQKLLSNAQELEKLGVTLPTQLSKEIENKLGQTMNYNMKEGFKKLQIPSGTDKPKNSEVEHYLEKYGIVNSKEDFSKISTVSNEITTNAKELADDEDLDLAFISLTTIKPSVPKSTTESGVVQHNVFSATKIIEAAIKRAATKIGVSTENTLGFRKRSDVDVKDMDTDDDLMAEFSELNYQIAFPDIISTEKPQIETSSTRTLDISQDLTELERLIKNLKELQALNISTSSDALRIADAAYLQTFQNSLNNDTLKNRRQSETTTTTATTTSTTPATSPTRLNFDLIALDDTNDNPANATTASEVTTTTEESRNGAISDLEDSFGGIDPVAEAEQPPKKKNGFYFLADWNSFLEVGSEDQDDQVVVKLSPKIGDPRLFIPVKIP